MPRPERFPKLLFFDLDGTLLAPGSVLTDRTLAALRAALDRGASLALATGGFSYRALQVARRIDGGAGRTWTATHNGAALWDPSGGLAYHHTMPADAMQAVLEVAGPRVWCVYEALSGEDETAVYYAGRHRKDLSHFVWGPQPPDAAPDVLHAARRAPRRTGRVGDERLGQVLGCWLLGSPEALASADSRVINGELLGARYLMWSQRLARILGRPRLAIVGRDIGPLGTHKGVAAGWLADHLKVDSGDTAAFGDADNDVEMLRFAGTAVAMANATPEAMAEANLVAPSHAEDGVARILEEWMGA
jgi:hydroxymethylpyrimidine pyrophosphatase-like HAD family hydrolase